MSSPTQRSLKHLRDNGWTACIVEKRVPFRNITVDAFGFGDLLAMRWSVNIGVPLNHAGEQEIHREIALVQTTTGDNMAARRTKVLSLTAAREWKSAGGIILLHGWSKKGSRGKRKTWQVREETIDFGGNEWNAQPAAAGAIK